MLTLALISHVDLNNGNTNQHPKISVKSYLIQKLLSRHKDTDK